VSTEVKHGPDPNFQSTIVGKFDLTMVCHRTTTPGLGAGGVTGFHYDSEQDAKRVDELLVMRTVFVDWWFREWAKHAPDLESGRYQFVGSVTETYARVRGLHIRE